MNWIEVGGVGLMLGTGAAVVILAHNAREVSGWHIVAALGVLATAFVIGYGRLRHGRFSSSADSIEVELDADDEHDRQDAH